MKLKRAVIIAINCPGYYSLAIHSLNLYASLDKYLKKRCKIYTVEYDLTIGESSIVGNIVKLEPDLIGFSCYIWNINRVIPLCRRLKEALPMSRIILGGQEVTNSTIDYLEKYQFIDIIVDGEGEETFKSIIFSMIEDEFSSLKEINGIQYRNDTEIVRNPPSHNIQNLDNIPSPYLEEKVRIPEKSGLGVMIDHVRGCPNKCAFCFESMRCKTPRAFSLDRVKDEIEWAKLKGYDYFHILDPILCLNNSKKLEFLNITFKNLFHGQNYRVSVEVYAENITKNNIFYFDCYHIFDIGLQTINPITNKNINRKFNIDRFINGFELLKGLNRTTNIYLIYGLPGDNYDIFMDNICFVDSLKPSTIFLNKLCVLDGTSLRHNAPKYNLDFEEGPPYEIISNQTYSYNNIIKSESFAENFMRYYNGS